MKLLVVDDQQRRGQFLERGLTDCAYAVRWARTCKDALEARVRSQVHRQSAVKQTMLEHRGIRVDLLSHTVQVNGRAVDWRAANVRCSKSSCRTRDASSPARPSPMLI